MTLKCHSRVQPGSVHPNSGEKSAGAKLLAQSGCVDASSRISLRLLTWRLVLQAVMALCMCGTCACAAA